MDIYEKEGISTCSVCVNQRIDQLGGLMSGSAVSLQYAKSADYLPQCKQEPISLSLSTSLDVYYLLFKVC